MAEPYLGDGAFQTNNHPNSSDCGFVSRTIGLVVFLGHAWDIRNQFEREALELLTCVESQELSAPLRRHPSDVS